MDQLASLNEAMDDGAERLDQLHQMYPPLATPVSRAGVEHWRSKRTRACIQNFGRAEPQATGHEQIKALALILLQENSLEDALEILMREHGIELTLPKLLHLIGKGTYISVLKRELRQLVDNAISFQQVASLWNELERPALGAPQWNSRSVSALSG